MTRYVALVRAVNVGGTGKLPMTELKAMCGDAGFTRVETYIASGNVVFESRAGRTAVKTALEASLLARLGKPATVVVRTASEMVAVLDATPFPGSEPKLIFNSCGMGAGYKPLIFQGARSGFRKNVVPRFCVL